MDDAASIKGSNTSRRSLHFDKNIAVEEADNGLQDYTDLQPRAPVAELLGEAAQLARCLPVFLQAVSSIALFVVPPRLSFCTAVGLLKIYEGLEIFVYCVQIEKSGTANLRRLFLFWAAVKWIQDVRPHLAVQVVLRMLGGVMKYLA